MDTINKLQSEVLELRLENSKLKCELLESKSIISNLQVLVEAYSDYQPGCVAGI